jgi:heat shock protein HtpX
MYEQISANKRNSILIISVFTVFILGLGYIFGRVTAFGPAGVVVAAVVAIAMSFSGYYYSDRIVLGMSRAKPAEGPEYQHLNNVVEGLAIAGGIPKPKVYIIDDSAPNAFATGRDPNHAAVAVTTGILQKLNRAELEGVIAHELSHVKNYDIRLMSIVVVLVGIVVLLSDWMIRSFWWGGGRRRGNDNEGGAGGIFFLVGIILAILSPIIAQLMQLAISRRREFLADANGAMLSRYPAGLAGALRKLAADTEPLEVANKATAHLYIVNPLKDIGGRINSLFNTHPPIEERIKRLEAM